MLAIVFGGTAEQSWPCPHIIFALIEYCFLLSFEILQLCTDYNSFPLIFNHFHEVVLITIHSDWDHSSAFPSIFTFMRFASSFLPFSNPGRRGCDAIPCIFSIHIVLNNIGYIVSVKEPRANNCFWSGCMELFRTTPVIPVGHLYSKSE